MVKRAVLAVSFVILSAWAGKAADLAVPPGTVLNCRLSQTLSTATKHSGAVVCRYPG